MPLQKTKHGFPRCPRRDELVQPWVQEQGVGNAGDAGNLQHFGSRRLVVGDPMRDCAVQSDIVAESEMPPRPTMHDDEPALGSQLDGDAMTGAVFFHGVHEYSPAVEHCDPVSMSPATGIVAAAVGVCVD